MSEIKRRSTEAVLGIIKDMSDRRGLRHEWEAIDEDIQEEIVGKWMGIIEKNFASTATTNVEDSPPRGQLERIADAMESLACSQRVLVLSHITRGVGPEVPPYLHNAFTNAIGALLVEGKK